MLHGLTHRLADRLFSGGGLPAIAKRSSIPRPRGTWKGKGAGRRRGRLVDEQLSTIANGRKPRNGRLYRLVRLALEALKNGGIRLVCGQLPVVSDSAVLASAIDLVGLTAEGELALIELKTGFDEGRSAPALLNGKPQMMQAPLAHAGDCVYHRHLAQLAATVAMFDNDEATAEVLRSHGVRCVRPMLMYVTDADTEIQELPEWWRARGARIVARCA